MPERALVARRRALVLAVDGCRVCRAQLGGRPTRPQVVPPQGPVRQVIFKNCTSCHGIDDYAYNALDRAGWDALHHGEAPRPGRAAAGAGARRSARLAGSALRPDDEAVSAHLRRAGSDDVLHRRRGRGAAEARVHVVPRDRAGQRRALQSRSLARGDGGHARARRQAARTKSWSGWSSGWAAPRAPTTVTDSSRMRRTTLFSLSFLLLAAVIVRAATADVADAAMRGDREAVRAAIARKADVNAAAGRWHHGTALGRRARRPRAGRPADSRRRACRRRGLEKA